MVASPETNEAEEYAVYSSLIESWYVNNNTRLIVIEDDSEPGTSGEVLDDSLKPLLEELPDVTEELIDAFKTRNRQHVPLKPLLSLSVPYVLIGNKEMDAIFHRDRDGWHEFYKRYANSPGTITLSRVGFNRELNGALVYIGHQSHWRAGSVAERKWGLESSRQNHGLDFVSRLVDILPQFISSELMFMIDPPMAVLVILPNRIVLGQRGSSAGNL
jgi:hypothetical protein